MQTPISLPSTRAREVQADHFADEIIEIADEAEHATTSEAVQAAKLRVDSRKWAAAHQRPKKRGDRLIHAGDSEMPVSFRDEDVPQLRARIAEHLGKARVDPGLLGLGGVGGEAEGAEEPR